MARSEAKTVEAYLAELPEERREVIAAVRDVILEHLPEGYVETMNWGMIAYEIPLKNYNALYLWGAYADPAEAERLASAFAAAGKWMDMGKSCLRFRRAEDLPLEAIAEIVAAHPPERLIELAEASRGR